MEHRGKIGSPHGRWLAGLIVVLAGLAMGMWTGTGLGAAWTQLPGAHVETADGPLVGLVAEDHRVFRNVPYAAPPLGELRWRSPQPAAPWTEPRDATQAGNRCPQPADPITGGDAGDEDCLTLTVTAPRTAAPGAGKPVMVWLHGAGAGSGAGQDYDATRLAVGGDVVVVTINYRLGVFGFFGYPGLVGSGGFGLEDQQAALRWVQRNARAFGGDPENVTLFGESSGGMNVCAHLTSPGAEGLFQRAIIQSGSCLTRFPPNSTFPGVPDTTTSIWSTPDEVASLGTALAGSAGCADAVDALTCLRELPATGLLQQPIAAAFGRAAFGNRVLPMNPAHALRDGGFHRVPIMSGATSEEATYFIAGFPPIDEKVYQELLDEAFAADAEDVARAYPVAAHTSAASAWASVVTDRAWVCPTYNANRLFAAHVPIYAYEFSDENAPLFFGPPELEMGAYHGSELAYLFDILGWTPEFTPGQEQLAQQVIDYWASFAWSGDPNGPGLPRWEPFAGGGAMPFVQSLAPGAAGVGPVDLAAEHKCAFWAQVEAMP